MNTDRWLLIAMAACVLALGGFLYWMMVHPAHTRCVTHVSGELDCWVDRGTETHVE